MHDALWCDKIIIYYLPVYRADYSANTAKTLFPFACSIRINIVVGLLEQKKKEKYWAVTVHLFILLVHCKTKYISLSFEDDALSEHDALMFVCAALPSLFITDLCC